MAIDVMIKRKVKPGLQARELVPLILHLRALATYQPGYISGTTLSNLEHPDEYGYWLDYLVNRFDVQLDADDTIISYLYKNKMLIKGEMIDQKNSFVLKSKSDGILRFLAEHSKDINEMIKELPGYIGSREPEE